MSQVPVSFVDNLDERWGWYLPAGKAYFGESFTTTGVRESKEKAGLDVVLDGIYRFEFSVEDGSVRFRVIFSAHQKDESKPLKMEADDESYGAEWFTVKEIDALAKKEPAMIEKINSIPRVKALKEAGDRRDDERTRGLDIVHVFDWVEQGTKNFDLKLYYGEDGQEIVAKNAKLRTKFFILLVIQSEELGNKFAVKKKVLKKGFNDFTESARELSNELTKHVDGLDSLEVSNICGIYHVAPKTKEDKATMTICYLAKTDKVGTKTKINFRSVADIEKQDNESYFAVKNVAEDVLAPLEILEWEGSKHVILG